MIGRIARTGKRGLILAYFFTARCYEVPSVSEIPNWQPGDASVVGKIGDLRILQGIWKVISALSPLDRTIWVVPTFGRTEALTGRAYRVVYDESDLLTPVSEERCDPESVQTLPKDGILGWGGIEAILPPGP